MIFRVTTLVRLCAATIIYLSLAANAAGQTKDEEGPSKSGGLPSRVVLSKAAKCSVGSDEVSKLLQTYGDFANWTELQNKLKAKIEACTGAKAAAEAPYLVTLITPDQNVGVVVPQDARYNPNMVGGPRSAYVMLLVEGHATEEKEIRSFGLNSTKIEDPVASQLPAAVKSFGTAVFGGTLAYIAPPKLSDYQVQAWESAKQAAAQKSENAAFISEPIKLPSSNVNIAESGTLKMWNANNKVEEVKISAAFTSKKPRRAEFTGVAGVLVGALAGDEKMKVDGDKYASDPLKRAITMVALSWHPTAYDDTLPAPTKAERIAILLGGVLTPAPGLGVGLSVLLMRGIAFNVGGAVMFVPTSRGGLGPKDAVPEGANQLRYGWTAGFFTGFNYVFKGD